MEKEIRAFIALEFDKEIQEELKRIQILLKRKIKGHISWVKTGNIHLTLRFLGNINTAQSIQIQEIISGICLKNEKIKIKLGSLGVFPNFNKPRVLWVAINEGAEKISFINSYLEKDLQKINFPNEEKPFHPHLTLARIKHLESIANIEQIIQEAAPQEISSYIEKIVLFKSTLTTRGAIYAKIFEEELLKTQKDALRNLSPSLKLQLNYSMEP